MLTSRSEISDQANFDSQASEAESTHLPQVPHNQLDSFQMDRPRNY